VHRGHGELVRNFLILQECWQCWTVVVGLQEQLCFFRASQRPTVAFCLLVRPAFTSFLILVYAHFYFSLYFYRAQGPWRIGEEFFSFARVLDSRGCCAGGALVLSCQRPTVAFCLLARPVFAFFEILCMLISIFPFNFIVHRGCVTYREAKILVKKGSTSESTKRGIARTVCHELAVRLGFGVSLHCGWRLLSFLIPLLV